MDRIIIAISELSKENWIIIYKFLKSIVNEASLDKKKDAFVNLKAITVGVRINTSLSPVSTSDVYSLYGEDVSDNILGTLSSDTCFSILYQKNNNTEDFTELVPFVMLQHEFNDAVSLGIDVDKLDKETQRSYKFKCSDFFILYDVMKPRLGNRSLYFINNEEIINKATGELSMPHVTSLAGKKEDGTSTYSGNPSRRFLPLIKITKKNYATIFGKKTDDKSLELRFVEDSINKIKKDWKRVRSLKSIATKLNVIFEEKESPFGIWFESGFFYSYEDELKNLNSNEILGIRNTLQIYKKSVVELVQNIVFHGGGEGFVYCVFDKKLNMAERYRERILNFDKYDDEARFLKIGLFDFGNLGIVDTFKTNADEKDTTDVASLSLRDFFDKDSVATTGLGHLYMRYAARLGIKTFVKTIVENNGYFAVDSNDHRSGKDGKRYIQTILKDRAIVLGSEEDMDFTNGTHYEIVLPVIASENLSSKILPLQRTSLLADSYKQSLNYLSQKVPLNALMLTEQDFISVDSSTSKTDQKQMIEFLGTKLMDEFLSNKGSSDCREIVLNLDRTKVIDPFLVFKIIAYIQVKSKSHGFERIILVNTTDYFVNEFSGLINRIIASNSGGPVWSRDTAIIIISENLYGSVIWGETKDELLFVNQEFQKLYCNDFFVAQTNEINENLDLLFQGSSPENNSIDENIKQKAYSFILPYDIIINIDKEERLSLFESFLNRLLKRRIDPKDLGFLVNHENTYIGNKIILKNYYEADMMFQNNFFTERFAFLITRNIQHELNSICELDSNRTQKKKLLLIGYNQYSEILLKAIKNSLKDEDVYLTILKEEKETFANDAYFDFDIDTQRNGEDTKNDLLKHPDNFLFVTIVPIGSTLSTNDKTIAFFKQWFNGKSSKSLDNDSFIYNHCVIVVRDDDTNCNVTKREREQKWDQIDLSNRVITTFYNNANKIHYTAQIGQAEEKKDDDNDSINWLKRLNNKISFPNNWWEEKYVNFTENSSINSQNLMGFPKAEIYAENIHEVELNRLYDLKNDIYKGHIEVLNCHNKYYIDTERFVKRKKAVLIEWLRKCVREKGRFNQDILNVIVTPNVEIESDFIFEVNKTVFDGNALIIYLDVNNWRNNMVHKLSFLKDLHKGSVKYHYVDHAFLMGETFHKSKSYLFSIVGDKDKSFDSIITVVNRLSYAKNQEIKNEVRFKIGNEVRFNMYAFVNLHYPASRDNLHYPASREGGQDCELCRLIEYYNELNKRTVLDSCHCAIKKNLDKLQIVSRNKLDKKKCSNRSFLRLVMTHEFYYRIAEIATIDADESYNFKQIYSAVKEELDGVYEQLSDSHVHVNSIIPKSKINQKINDWLLPKLHNVPFEVYDKLYNCFHSKLEVDKKISFLKVISSPPLSKFIAIRNYAHEKLLHELFLMISKTKDVQNDFVYDDLKIIKSILKSLSFLKSNALVRKDVIVGVWRVLGKVIENLNKEKKIIKENKETLDDYIKELAKRIYESQRFQQGLFSESVDDLKNEIKLANILADDLEHDLKAMDIGLIVLDFSRDVQFFIKNAIVEDEAKATFLGELLRRGEEMSTFNTIEISKTVLSLGKEEDKLCLLQEHGDNTNELFGIFDTKNPVYKEYTNFLVWLFYDNTTIIRKTLDNFSKEILKDKECYDLFYKERKEGKKSKQKEVKEELELNEIIVFKDKLVSKQKFFEDKVKKEYYYSSFLPYLSNGDGIDYVKKLLYVAYAKLKLKDLTNNKHKTRIETDVKDLLEILSAIVGADASFMTIRKDKRPYPISSFGRLGKQERGWDYDNWIFDEEYYSYRLCRYFDVKTPLVVKFNMPDSIYKEREERKNKKKVLIYRERTDLNMHSMGAFLITDSESRIKRDSTAAVITFLYNDNNKLINNEIGFRVGFQESGRLLLLLKKEINEYVMDFLIKDKVFDLWLEKFVNSRKFEKAYSESAHTFKYVYDEMQEFENLNEDTLSVLSNTWFFLTNETINFLYSNIVKKTNEDSSNNINATKPLLSLFPSYIIDDENTLGDTFNKKYIFILGQLLEKRWNCDCKSKRNTITINGKDIYNFELDADAELSKVKIYCNKHILRTFVAQCIHNSLSPMGKHGHRGQYEIKNIEITITKTCIIIEDSCLAEYYSKEEKERRTNRFEQKKEYIRQMDCEKYSSTTLTSLQGFINYMRDYKDKDGTCKYKNFDCNYVFNKDNNFKITINFDKNE